MAVALIELRDYTFAYPGADAPVLNGLTLDVREGEFLVLCGPSGCGKTTLLRQLKRELAPAGTSDGILRYRGAAVPDDARMPDVGLVMQDPDNQIVSERVVDELAFALENAGTELSEMRRRIAEMVHFFALEPLLHAGTDELSGGQKQLLNLASVLLAQPRVLLLDEPTAQLDPVAARHFLQWLARLNEEFEMTIILCEHRLEELYGIADRVALLDRGVLRYVGSPREVIRGIWTDRLSPENAAFLSYVPDIPRAALEARGASADTEHPRTARTREASADTEHSRTAGTREASADTEHPRTAGTREASADTEPESGEPFPPLTVKEGRRWLRRTGARLTQAWRASQRAVAASRGEEPVFRCRDVAFRYGNRKPFVLKGASLDIRRSEILAIMGGNGSGKSTLLHVLAGLVKPEEGSVRLAGEDVHRIPAQRRYRRIGLLPQHPLALFAHDTVEQDLRRAAETCGADDPDALADRQIARFGLEAVRGRHPHDLSGGERQLAGLALVLTGAPQLLLLDEPTKGLDPVARRHFGEMLAALASEGMSIALVTHDVGFAAERATRCAMLFDGVCTGAAETAAFFRGNYFYTTALDRLLHVDEKDASASAGEVRR